VIKGGLDRKRMGEKRAKLFYERDENYDVRTVGKRPKHTVKKSQVENWEGGLFKGEKKEKKKKMIQNAGGNLGQKTKGDREGKKTRLRGVWVQGVG